MILTEELYKKITNAEPYDTIVLLNGAEIRLKRGVVKGSYRGYSQNEYSGTVVFDGITSDPVVSLKKSDLAYSLCEMASKYFPDCVGPMSDLNEFLSKREERLENDKKEKERKISETEENARREKELEKIRLTEEYAYVKKVLEGPTPDAFATDAYDVSLTLPKSMLEEFGLSRPYVSSDTYECGGHDTLIKPLVSKKCDVASAYSVIASMLYSVITKKEKDVTEHLKEKISPLIHFNYLEGRINLRDYIDRIKYKVDGAETLHFTQYDAGNVEGLADVDANDCYLVVWKEISGGWTRMEDDDFGPGVILVSPVGLELLREFKGGDADLRDLDSFEKELEN